MTKVNTYYRLQSVMNAERPALSKQEETTIKVSMFVKLKNIFQSIKDIFIRLFPTGRREAPVVVEGVWGNYDFAKIKKRNQEVDALNEEASSLKNRAKQLLDDPAQSSESTSAKRQVEQLIKQACALEDKAKRMLRSI